MYTTSHTQVLDFLERLQRHLSWRNLSWRRPSLQNNFVFIVEVPSQAECCLVGPSKCVSATLSIRIPVIYRSGRLSGALHLDTYWTACGPVRPWCGERPRASKFSKGTGRTSDGLVRHIATNSIDARSGRIEVANLTPIGQPRAHSLVG